MRKLKMEKGVTFTGSLIVDVIKMIDRYPPEGNLCNISDVTRCVGVLPSAMSKTMVWGHGRQNAAPT